VGDPGLDLTKAERASVGLPILKRALAEAVPLLTGEL